jgi:hypothetical protein
MNRFNADVGMDSQTAVKQVRSVELQRDKTYTSGLELTAESSEAHDKVSDNGSSTDDGANNARDLFDIGSDASDSVHSIKSGGMATFNSENNAISSLVQEKALVRQRHSSNNQGGREPEPLIDR